MPISSFMTVCLIHDSGSVDAHGQWNCYP